MYSKEFDLAAIIRRGAARAGLVKGYEHRCRKKVFALDVLACPECTGRMRLIAFIARPAVARRILDHLGLDATGPPVARAQLPPELLHPGPDYSAPDPIHPG